MSFGEFLFWFSFALLAATYVVYPSLMALIGRLAVGRDSDQRKDEGERGPLPAVTLVVPARNEESVIQAKLESCLGQKYPEDRLDVLLVSDGSTDDTVVIARSFSSARVRIVELGTRVGKAEALNAAMHEVDAPVVVLTDARQVLDRHAVRSLVDRFSNPRVGAVSGDLRYDRSEEDGMRRALHRYWDYEKTIRLGESRLHSCVGATGALYAIRRALWSDLPQDTLLDDVYTPMRIVLAGHRVVFEPRAWAWDQASTGDEQEWSRRVRTLTGNYQLLLSIPALLNPLRNPIWLQFGFHKLGRLLSPVPLAGLLVGAWMSSGPVYSVAFWLQAIFWSFAAITYLTRSRLRFSRPLGLAYAFAVTQGAALVAFTHFIRRDWNVWSR